MRSFIEIIPFGYLSEIETYYAIYALKYNFKSKGNSYSFIIYILSWCSKQKQNCKQYFEQLLSERKMYILFSLDLD